MEGRAQCSPTRRTAAARHLIRPPAAITADVGGTDTRREIANIVEAAMWRPIWPRVFAGNARGMSLAALLTVAASVSAAIN